MAGTWLAEWAVHLAWSSKARWPRARLARGPPRRPDFLDGWPDGLAPGWLEGCPLALGAPELARWPRRFLVRLRAVPLGLELGWLDGLHAWFTEGCPLGLELGWLDGWPASRGRLSRRSGARLARWPGLEGQRGS